MMPKGDEDKKKKTKRQKRPSKSPCPIKASYHLSESLLPEETPEELLLDETEVDLGIFPFDAAEDVAAAEEEDDEEEEEALPRAAADALPVELEGAAMPRLETEEDVVLLAVDDEEAGDVIPAKGGDKKGNKGKGN